MDNLFSRIPEVICNYNPCLSEKCWEIRDQCVVDLKCRPVFIGIDIRLIPPQCQGKCSYFVLYVDIDITGRGSRYAGPISNRVRNGKFETLQEDKTSFFICEPETFGLYSCET